MAQSKDVIELTKEMPAHSTTVRMRVSDPFGVTVANPSGHTTSHERGDVIEVDQETARQLFTQGKASPEEMRPDGAPPFVERR